jgi:sugar phosphate permease
MLYFIAGIIVMGGGLYTFAIMKDKAKEDAQKEIEDEHTPMHEKYEGNSEKTYI